MTAAAHVVFGTGPDGRAVAVALLEHVRTELLAAARDDTAQPDELEEPDARRHVR
jgi:hypothetical protein